ncbi:MAG: histidine kinase, partial [Deltaproteobacteria bacterium]|nr:histidine kinase [Deltaproteobacteria bacterium]
KDISHVFDPYFTTKQSGTGLGLAIVHKIIESHEGDIKLDSEPGRGTRVTIILPVFDG